jgi:acetyl-CoA synthetase
MTDTSLIPVPFGFAREGTIDAEGYHSLYRQSVEEPDAFWAAQAKIVDWIKPFSKVKNTSFTGDVSIRWFEDGTLNVSANCVDRHAATQPETTAIIWEGDDPEKSRHISYLELKEQVCRLANALKKRGVKRGDRVTIYLPMIPEAAFAMLAHRRGPLRGVRRVFAGQPRQPHSGRRKPRHHYRGRRYARRPVGAAESECRRSTAGLPGCGHRVRGAADGGAGCLGRRPRCLVS